MPDRDQNDHNPRKRKNTSTRGGGSRGRGGQARGRGHKRQGLGRVEYHRQDREKRVESNEESTKRQKREHDGNPGFSQEEVNAEERRPKKKVAVMVGYSGSGYKGMQINSVEKTIEGDLFAAFVAAGAISKANANDPKKSALVRCARTDKGVHAAGNVISLKLIVEDPDTVARINSHLSPQIRVWGIQRTVGSFSAYQACDSRWYEYLIPTHSFLPPHPSSPLAKKLAELADEAGDREGYEARQGEVSGFWPRAEEEYIKPILEDLPESIRHQVQEALYEVNTDPETAAEKSEALSSSAETTVDLNTKKDLDAAIKRLRQAYLAAKRSYRIDPARLARIQPTLDLFLGTKNFHNYTIGKSFRDASAKRLIKSFKVNPNPILTDGNETNPLKIPLERADVNTEAPSTTAEATSIDQTIDLDKDPSPSDTTQWLSIKIHGQSFMMHQIRKMISMVALCIRSGTDPAILIPTTFTATSFSIPKAPGLGLLLERPVFSSYNAGAAAKFERDEISFDKFEAAMEEFKAREIYNRIWREEVQGSAFQGFWAHVDNLKAETFWYVSSMGISAVERARAEQKANRASSGTCKKVETVDSEDEGDAMNAEAGEGDG